MRILRSGCIALLLGLTPCGAVKAQPTSLSVAGLVVEEGTGRRLSGVSVSISVTRENRGINPAEDMTSLSGVYNLLAEGIQPEIDRLFILVGGDYIAQPLELEPPVIGGRFEALKANSDLVVILIEGVSTIDEDQATRAIRAIEATTAVRAATGSLTEEQSVEEFRDRTTRVLARLGAEGRAPLDIAMQRVLSRVLESETIAGFPAPWRSEVARERGRIIDDSMRQATEIDEFEQKVNAWAREGEPLDDRTAERLLSLPPEAISVDWIRLEWDDAIRPALREGIELRDLVDGVMSVEVTGLPVDRSAHREERVGGLLANDGRVTRFELVEGADASLEYRRWLEQNPDARAFALLQQIERSRLGGRFDDAVAGRLEKFRVVWAPVAPGSSANQ